VVARENRLRQEGGRLNIVMMGQGEPLPEPAQRRQAARILLDPAGFAFSPRRITVSTAGIVPQIASWGANRCVQACHLAQRFTEEQRQELMPITRKYT